MAVKRITERTNKVVRYQVDTQEELDGVLDNIEIGELVLLGSVLYAKGYDNQFQPVAGGGEGNGDMLKNVYDPWNRAGDAFDMDKMTESATKKIMTSSERSKLSGIESNATADQTGAEIKALYEAQADTNPFSDSLKTKLDNIEDGATADQTGAEIKAAYEAEANTNAFSDAYKDKLDNIESGATADLTGAEIKALYEAEANTNAFTDALKQKIEEADVVHYGSPLSNLTELSAIPEANITDRERRYVASEVSDYFYNALATSGDVAPDDQTGGTGFWVQVNVGGETSASIKTKYEANANTNAYTDTEKTKLAGIEANATADQTGAEIKAAYEAEANTNAFTDAYKVKIDGIEAGATADQTGAEIKSLYEAEANTNAYTDAEKSKLAGIEAGAKGDLTGAEIKALYEAEADTNAYTDAEKSKLAGIVPVNPGGSDTQFQYNNGGSHGGVAEMTYNDATGLVAYNGNEIVTKHVSTLSDAASIPLDCNSADLVYANLDTVRASIGFVLSNAKNPSTINLVVKASQACTVAFSGTDLVFKGYGASPSVDITEAGDWEYNIMLPNRTETTAGGGGEDVKVASYEDEVGSGIAGFVQPYRGTIFQVPAGQGGTLSKAEFHLAGTSGSGIANIRIYALGTGTPGVDAKPGGQLAISDDFDWDNVVASGWGYEIPFSGLNVITLVENTYYAIVMSNLTDGSNAFVRDNDTPGSVPSNMNMVYSADGSTWTSVAAQAYLFRLYLDQAGDPVTNTVCIVAGPQKLTDL